MSDYIDELVSKHFSCTLRPPCAYHEPLCPAPYIVMARPLARAVAERVKASARVCVDCRGSGIGMVSNAKSFKCRSCAGRGVTFGGEA